MISHYLLSSVRHIRTNKLFSVINIAGLSLAFTAAILIGLFVRNELSYEHWLPEYENIYRVSAGSPGGPFLNTGPPELGRFIALEFPEIDAVTRLILSPASRIRSGETTHNANISWVDRNFLEVFQLPAVDGNLEGALDRPDSLVLTASQALRFFGRRDVAGEVLLVDDAHPMTVTAVIEDLPSNTHLNFSILGPSHAEFSFAAAQDALPLPMFAAKPWSAMTYVKLSPGDSAEEIADRFPDMLDRRVPLPGGRATSEGYAVVMTALDDIHLQTTENGNTSRDLSTVLTASAIGLLIILGACVNYTNLVTALGVGRAKDLVIRKALGADRASLILHSLTETFLYIAISMIIALALTELLLPFYNRFLQRTIDFSLASDSALLGALSISTALLAIGTGLYPALAMARHSTIPPLDSSKAASKDRLRSGLIFTQFSILITLLIATLVIQRQVDLGVAEALRQEDDPVLLLNAQCREPLINAFESLPLVMGAACSNIIPQRDNGFRSTMAVGEDATRGIPVRYASLDQGWFDLHDIALLAGRSFDRSIPGDHAPVDNVWRRPEAIVINQTAARSMEVDDPADALGLRVVWRHVFNPQVGFTPFHQAEVIGVVEDFQMGSIRDAIEPAVFFMDPRMARLISIRILGESVPEALAAIDEVWEALGEPRPIQRYFFDQVIEDMYRDILNQAQLLTILVAVALAISILGMVGLAVFTAQRRTKEMGIRKVLGSSRNGIILLLLTQFSRPVLSASLLAWPAAYYFSTLWLQDFAQRIELQPWMFILCSFAALAVAMMTVFAHAYSMSNVQPVKALRYE